MSSDVRTEAEFMVAIRGRGFLGGAWGDVVVENRRDAYICPSKTAANDAADKLRGQYTTLGASDLAELVEVQARTATTTYTDWAPVKRVTITNA